MKKQTKAKKLILAKEKVRDLQKPQLDQASGGRGFDTTDHSVTQRGAPTE